MSLKQDNLPSSKPIETMIGNFNDLNKKPDSVINKNKKIASFTGALLRFLLAGHKAITNTFNSNDL